MKAGHSSDPLTGAKDLLGSQAEQLGLQGAEAVEEPQGIEMQGPEQPRLPSWVRAENKPRDWIPEEEKLGEHLGAEWIIIHSICVSSQRHPSLPCHCQALLAHCYSLFTFPYAPTLFSHPFCLEYSNLDPIITSSFLK